MLAPADPPPRPPKNGALPLKRLAVSAPPGPRYGIANPVFQRSCSATSGRDPHGIHHHRRRQVSALYVNNGPVQFRPPSALSWTGSQLHIYPPEI